MQAKHTLRVPGIFMADTVIIVVRWLNWKLRARLFQTIHGYSSSRVTSSAAAQVVTDTRHYATSSTQSSSTHATFASWCRLRQFTTIYGAIAMKRRSLTARSLSSRTTRRRKLHQDEK